jgi:hypothetical protein
MGEQTEHCRYAQIMRAYHAALDGRDPDTVYAPDLLPAIFASVPDADVEEVAAALRLNADSLLREAL